MLDDVRIDISASGGGGGPVVLLLRRLCCSGFVSDIFVPAVCFRWCPVWASFLGSEIQCVRSSRSFSLRSETLVSAIVLRSETLGAKIAKVSLRFQSLGVCARQPDLRLRLPIRSESLINSEIP